MKRYHNTKRTKMSYLILVRHGESRWNIANKFTGWVDVPLSEVGINEALICAKMLEGLQLDVAFTSELERAHETLLLVLAKQDCTGIFLHDSKKRNQWALHPHKFEKNEIPIYSSDKLNERYYGKLQGLNKQKMREKYGDEQVFMWRRSYDERPPGGESLKDVYKRAVPYFQKNIMPRVRKNENVIVCAHGNSLRAIIKYLDDIPDNNIPHLELPLGKPIIYKYSQGKLKKENHVHSFNRPVHWARPKEYTLKHNKKKSKRTLKKNKK